MLENPYIKEDFQRIIKILSKIFASKAEERFFRTSEGRMNDGVVAVPLDTVRRKGKKRIGTLRLYCLRLSDDLLIIGNGGIKTSDSYNTDPVLSGYVSDLQHLEKVIQNMQKNGYLDIDGTEIRIAPSKKIYI